MSTTDEITTPSTQEIIPASENETGSSFSTTTTTVEDEKIPKWVIPTIIGGVVFVTILIIVIYVVVKRMMDSQYWLNVRKRMEANTSGASDVLTATGGGKGMKQKLTVFWKWLLG